MNDDTGLSTTKRLWHCHMDAGGHRIGEAVHDQCRVVAGGAVRSRPQTSGDDIFMRMMRPTPNE